MGRIKKISLLAVFIIFISFSQTAIAQDSYDAGFVTGIWFSKKPIFVGDVVRIYSAVQNELPFDITGNVEFSVDGFVVETSEISAIRGGLIEVWHDHSFDYGEHELEVKILSAQSSEAGEESENINLSQDILRTSIFVDNDTDNDQIGDEIDEDDDNDDVSDTEEEILGTEPLNPDTDGDGLKDGEEENLGTEPLNPDTDNDGIEDGEDSEPLVFSESVDNGGDEGGEEDAAEEDTTDESQVGISKPNPITEGIARFLRERQRNLSDTIENNEEPPTTWDRAKLIIYKTGIFLSKHWAEFLLFILVLFLWRKIRRIRG